MAILTEEDVATVFMYASCANGRLRDCVSQMLGEGEIARCDNGPRIFSARPRFPYEKVVVGPILDRIPFSCLPALGSSPAYSAQRVLLSSLGACLEKFGKCFNLQYHQAVANRKSLGKAGLKTVAYRGIMNGKGWPDNQRARAVISCLMTRG